MRTSFIRLVNAPRSADGAKDTQGSAMEQLDAELRQLTERLGTACQWAGRRNRAMRRDADSADWGSAPRRTERTAARTDRVAQKLLVAEEIVRDCASVQAHLNQVRAALGGPASARVPSQPRISGRRVARRAEEGRAGVAAGAHGVWDDEPRALRRAPPCCRGCARVLVLTSGGVCRRTRRCTA